MPDFRGGANKCNWISRKGSVRDNPSTGIIECQSCQLVTLASDLSQQVNYESGTMHDWASGYGGTLPFPEMDTLRRVDAMEDYQKKHESLKSILDFGCGDGGMVEALSNYFEMIGVEPDLQAKENATEKGIKIYESAEKVIEAGITVDAVTLFHVVEHFYDPTPELQRIYKILKPQGLIIIETPNSNDALLTKYKNTAFQNFTYWSHHPMVHSHQSLAALVERNGFTILENQGVQRYDLNNHLYWLSHGQPGGQEIWKNSLLSGVLSSYAESLVQNQICDTLWLVAQKTG